MALLPAFLATGLVGLAIAAAGCGSSAQTPTPRPTATPGLQERFLAALTATAAARPTPTVAPPATLAPPPTFTPTSTFGPTPVSTPLRPLGPGPVVTTRVPLPSLPPAPTRVPLSIKIGYTATVLKDGRVLVLGRWKGAEIFDPETETWEVMPNFERRPYAHTATLLHDGRVLVVGGTGESSGPPPVTIFDPETGEFASGLPTEQPRWRPTSILLADCTVLVIGGVPPERSVYPNSAEIFDPSSGRWKSGGVMVQVRGGAEAVRLPDGRVLVIGGGRDVGAEIFDPVTHIWDPAEHPDLVGFGSWVVLNDGRILAMISSPTTITVAMPATTIAAATPPTAIAMATPVTTIAVLTTTIPWIGSPAVGETGAWVWSQGTPRPRATGGTVLPLPDGRVLVMGGYEGSFPIGDVYIYDPSADEWTKAPPLEQPRANAVGRLLHDGRVLLVGGTVLQPNEPEPELYEPPVIDPPYTRRSPLADPDYCLPPG